MAGLAGWIAPARGARDEAGLAAMAAVLAHRTRTGETLRGLVDRSAKRQLVLSATLCDERARVSLAIDGVLANAAELRARLAKGGYRCAGESAEEVLLRAYQYWDKDVVKYLRGCFAFALWDGRKERLLLARDRFGEKPLYLHERDGALTFASEPKALLATGIEARVDLSALWDCLAYRYAPGSRTLFAGIRGLPPGSYALWQFGRLREVRYWVAPDRNPPLTKAHGDAVGGFLHALHDAVRQHAAGGMFLSGGLDSAVLAAVSSQQGIAPRTFSLGFEGERGSELPHAASLAKHFGTQHHELVIAPRELLTDLNSLVALRDAPVSRPSDLAVHRLAREAGRVTKTVVTGDGCDEVLAGYRRYVAEARHLPKRIFAPLVSAGRFDTVAAELKLSGWRERLVGKTLLRGSPAQAAENEDGNTPLRRALYRDQTTCLPDQLLERTDRATMGACVQARLPFLDHCLAEYVSELPDDLRVRGMTTKWILREAAKRLLPAQLQRRPKSGWRLDAASWLRNELRDLVVEHLQSASSVTRQYYDAATLDRVIARHLQGKKNYETLIWTLLNIEIWHRTYRPG